MTTTHDGGPAIPQGPFYFHGCEPPMTKRELFAAMAMEGLVSAITILPPGADRPWDEKGVSSADWVGRAAVLYADALLAELARTDGGTK